MSARHTVRALALITALALVAAACGDDDDDDASSTTTTAATEETTTTSAAPELTGDPIVLMALYEGSGAVATPEVPEGAIGAAEAINAAGGIDGRPVEIIECDLANDPNQATACGQQAVDEGVVAVVGPVSANAGQYFPALEAAKIPVVGNTPASVQDFLSPASYPLYGGIITASAGLADALVMQGATTVSIARIDLAAAAAIGGFANAALERHGLVINNDIPIPVGAPDMATYVAAALEGGTDGVLVGLTGQDATNFIIALRQANPDVLVSATTTEFAAVIEALGDAATGIIATDFFYDEQTNPEAYGAYVADMEAAGYDEFSGFRRNAYAAVKLVAEVVSGLTEITSAALYDALPSVDGVDVGLLPPVQFVTGGIGGIPRAFNPCGVYQQLEGDEFVSITDGFINVFTGEAC